MNRVIDHVAADIVTALAISAYNRAAIGDVCSHLAISEPNGTIHGANNSAQVTKNNADFQTIFQIEKKTEIMPDINNLVLQRLSIDEAP